MLISNIGKMSKNTKWDKNILINKIYNPKFRHYSHEHLHFKLVSEYIVQKYKIHKEMIKLFGIKKF